MGADIISGIGGAVQGEDCVRLWSTRRISLPGMAICSASDGSVVRGPGIADWQGVYAGFGYQPTNLAGDLFQFVGSTRDGKGATSIADGAIVAQTNINWDIEGNKFIEYTNFFEAATGALTYGSASATDVWQWSFRESGSVKKITTGQKHPIGTRGVGHFPLMNEVSLHIYQPHIVSSHRSE